MAQQSSPPSTLIGSLKQKDTDIKSRQMSRQDAFCVKTSTDGSLCGITGMCLLSPNILIVADMDNMTIKMIDTCRKSVTDCLQLDTGPRDVTTVNGTELAATLPNFQSILFISVSLDKLEKNRSIKTEGKCAGISCYQGKLVVSFCDPAIVKILDINGIVKVTVNGDNIFYRPFYVATDYNSIYVTDWYKGTITKLNWEGDIVGSYSGMVNPRGIALSGRGTVFVCDYQKNVIEEISEDFSIGRCVLQVLNCPQSVCWCIETSTLCVSCYADDEKYDNFLQIYS